MRKNILLVLTILLLSLSVFAQNANERGATLVDSLQIQSNQIRTIPQYPLHGVWGMLLGTPNPGDSGSGIMVANGDALLYPATELLLPDEGSIQFALIYKEQQEGAANPNRTLFDTIPNPTNSSSRHILIYNSGKLTLTVSNHANQTYTLEGNVNWQNDTIHNISYRWSPNELVLYVDNNAISRATLPEANQHGILSVFFGNNKDMNQPADMIFRDVAFATKSMSINPAQVVSQFDDTILTEDERIILMSTGNQRRINPVLESVLRPRNRPELNYFYAVEYNDIGDYDRAIQTIAHITNNPNDSLYVLGVFLRADILVNMRRFMDAYDQLQVLVGNADMSISIAARVRQALVLFNSGSTEEAITLFGNIIDQYGDHPEVNSVYFWFGYDKYTSGNYKQAVDVFYNIGRAGAKPRESTPIGQHVHLKVMDPDLAYKNSDVGIPIVLITRNGDRETIMLKSSISPGMFTGSIMVSLGESIHEDGILQVMGSNDFISATYTERLSKEGTNIPKTIEINIKTDGEITAIAQSTLEIYNEAKKYQERLILSRDWDVIGTLPDDAGEFFKNSETGLVHLRGHHFDRNFLRFLKPGQGIYIEVNDPDCSITDGIDTLKIEAFSSSNPNNPITVQLRETGPRTGIFSGIVKTELGEASETSLSVGQNDRVTIRYADSAPAPETSNPVHEATVNVQAMDARLSAGVMLPHWQSGVSTYVRLARVPADANLKLQIDDRDMDISDSADKITANIRRANGTLIPVTFTETSPHSGIFVANVKLSPTGGAGTVAIDEGEIFHLVYEDSENVNNTPKTLELEIRSVAPVNATFKIQHKEVIYPEGTAEDARALTRPIKTNWNDTTVLTPGETYRLIITDLDVIPNVAGPFYINARLQSSGKAYTNFGLHVHNDWQTNEIMYIGDFYVRLGDENDSDRAFFSQTGYSIDMTEAQNNIGIMTLPAINVQGIDTVTLTYVEPITAEKQKNIARTVKYRVAMDAKFSVLDLKGQDIETIKPGQEFELQVEDSGGDISGDRDKIVAVLRSANNDMLQVTLNETDLHTGIFTALVKTDFGKTANNTDNILQVDFSSSFAIAYRNTNSISGTPNDIVITIPTVGMSESEGRLITKIFTDQKFEIETNVRLGESLYHIGAAELVTNPPAKDAPRTNESLQEAARILEGIVDKYPTNSYAVESLFLTGKVRKEEGKHDVAEQLFLRIVNEYPNSEIVPQALYQLLALYYEQGKIDPAIDVAMQLIYAYPNNALVADAFLRIATYYYSTKDYIKSAHIYNRMLERFPDYPDFEAVKYRIGTAYYYVGVTDKQYYDTASKVFLELEQNFPEHELADDALYWAAQCYDQRNQPQRAYTIITKLLIVYPEGDIKNYATRFRDRLKAAHPHLEAEPF